MSTDSIWFATLNAAERREWEATREGDLLATPDVLVIGAGLIGLATAYFAVERGAKVQVIDAGLPAAGASGANAGGIFPNVEVLAYPAALHPLASLSRDLWGRLSLRPGFNFDWRVSGYLLVDQKEIGPSAEAFAAEHLEKGYSLHAIDGEQIALLEPSLKPGIKHGVHYPSEAQLHPVKAVLSFVRNLQKKGSRVCANVRALNFDKPGDKITAVQTTGGCIEPKRVVIATGYDGGLLKQTEAKWPVTPICGQLIATDPLPRLLKGPVCGEYLIFQLPTGEIVSGGNIAPGIQTENDPAVDADIERAAVDLIPTLKDVPFTRKWFGMRPGTPDGLPVIDRVPGAENALLACGHYKKGVLLAPATGKLLADWLMDDTQPELLEPLSWKRFS